MENNLNMVTIHLEYTTYRGMKGTLGSTKAIILGNSGVFGKGKLLYKFGTVQAIKYNPCI